MSIYLAKKELSEILDKSTLKYNIHLPVYKKVATFGKDKNILKFKDYNEETLEKLIKKHKTAIVNSDFWNYNYCTYKNVDPKISKTFVNNIEEIVDNLGKFTEGTMTTLVILHEILLKTFKIRSREAYTEYLNEIKLSRKIIRNFMINMEYTLPLTENYLALITETFDDETIYDFVFKECCEFTIDEFNLIMKVFNINNIHDASFYIMDNFRSNVKRLQYLERCLNLYEERIDLYEKMIYTKKNKNPYLGYYLLTMKLKNEREEELYYSVMRKYIDKKGSLDITVSDDEDDNYFIEVRLKEINEYFNRF